MSSVRAGNDATLTSQQISCWVCPMLRESPEKLQDIIITAPNTIYLRDLNFLLHFSFNNTNST